jgi:hypothetical protein
MANGGRRIKMFVRKRIGEVIFKKDEPASAKQSPMINAGNVPGRSLNTGALQIM